MTKRTNGKVETKTIVMSYDNFESAIVTFLYATKAIPENWDVIWTDLGVPLNEDGLVEFDIEVAKPVVRKLEVVTEGFTEKTEEQPTLPFDTFETIRA